MQRVKLNGVLVAAASLALAAPMVVLAQKVGQSASIQYGVVSSARQIDLANKSAVPAGALVGGTLGLVSASGKSSGAKARNSIVGAVAGGIVAGAAQGKPQTVGMAYAVATSPSSSIQIVTDQREIRVGDCVAVETVGETANLRRVTSEYCSPAAASAVSAVASESRKDADECAQAKQELVSATSAAAVNLAGQKVTLLCND